MTLMSLLLTMEGAIGQGVVWGIMAIGVYISYRLLDFADLSVDGSLATGGCVAAVMMINNVPTIIAVLIAFIAGGLAGAMTGLLNTTFKIPPILAGILTQLGLYSINLRILGRSNQTLLKVDTLFKSVVNSTGLNLQLVIVVIGLLFVFVTILVLYWFFGTEIGSAIRATGANKQMVRALGVNTNTTIIFGLMLSNALVAMSGALIAQTQGSADIKMGIGAIVIGLASIIIGESFFKKRKNFALKLFTIVIGSIVYRIVVALVLQLGLSTDDLKLFTAVLVAIFLALPHVIASQRQTKLYKEHKGGIQ